MIIRFGLAFDGLRPRLPENPVDDVVLGPAGLLGVLESQLGLPPVSAQPGEALLAYRTCLEEADAAAVEPRFYRRSLAVDPVGVARALLAWREQWYEAGWGGTFAGDAPAVHGNPIRRSVRLTRGAIRKCARDSPTEFVYMHWSNTSSPPAKRVNGRSQFVLGTYTMRWVLRTKCPRFAVQ